MTKPERDEADETEPPEATDPLVVALAPLVETICDLTAEGSQERKAALTIVLGLPGRIRAAVAKPCRHSPNGTLWNVGATAVAPILP